MTKLFAVLAMTLAMAMPAQAVDTGHLSKEEAVIHLGFVMRSSVKCNRAMDTEMEDVLRMKFGGSVKDLGMTGEKFKGLTAEGAVQFDSSAKNLGLVFACSELVRLKVLR